MTPPPAPVSKVVPDPALAGARVAFLGPFGTFCEQAARQIVPDSAELVPVGGERLAMDAVRRGDVDRAVVPIENSVEGGVHATLDALVSGDPLVIVAEMIVPVGFTLAVRPGTKRADIKLVGTHPHAWAQCRNWMVDNLPGVRHAPATSTAAGAQLLAEDDNCSYQAALCSAVSATRYGLEALESDVADNPGAVTRFVLLAPPQAVPRATGADKTTLQVRLGADRSGGLLTMLEQFSARGVNLSRIESRPVPNYPGSYSFSLDIEGHVNEERVMAAMIGLHRTCPEVIFLGSYPRADRVETPVQPGTDDSDFQAARAWVDAVRRGEY